MFVAAELRDWLLDAGFTSVNLVRTATRLPYGAAV
jgi:hypothetical protein